MNHARILFRSTYTIGDISLSFYQCDSQTETKRCEKRLVSRLIISWRNSRVGKTYNILFDSNIKI